MIKVLLIGQYMPVINYTIILSSLLQYLQQRTPESPASFVNCRDRALQFYSLTVKGFHAILCSKINPDGR